jgi:hypothetical protein
MPVARKGMARNRHGYVGFGPVRGITQQIWVTVTNRLFTSYSRLINKLDAT